jgi:hypothetical protein
MLTQEKFPSEPVEKTPSESFSTYVPVAVGDCIRDDAQHEDRTESYIIARLLKKHYAKRVKPATAQHRRAA